MLDTPFTPPPVPERDRELSPSEKAQITLDTLELALGQAIRDRKRVIELEQLVLSLKPIANQRLTWIRSPRVKSRVSRYRSELNSWEGLLGKISKAGL